MNVDTDAAGGNVFLEENVDSNGFEQWVFFTFAGIFQRLTSYHSAKMWTSKTSLMNAIIINGCKKKVLA